MTSANIDSETCEGCRSDLRAVRLSLEGPSRVALRCNGALCRMRVHMTTIARAHVEGCHGECCNSDCCWRLLYCHDCGAVKRHVVCPRCVDVQTMFFIASGETFVDYVCPCCAGVLVVSQPSSDGLRRQIEKDGEGIQLIKPSQRAKLPQRHGGLDAFVFTESLHFCGTFEEYDALLVEHDREKEIASVATCTAEVLPEEEFGDFYYPNVPDRFDFLFEHQLAVGVILEVIFQPHGDPGNRVALFGRIEVTSFDNGDLGHVGVIPVDDVTAKLFEECVDSDLEENVGGFEERTFLIEEMISGSGKDCSLGDLFFFIELQRTSKALILQSIVLQENVPFALQEQGFRRLTRNDLRQGVTIAMATLSMHDDASEEMSNIELGSGTVLQLSLEGTEKNVFLHMHNNCDFLQEYYDWDNALTIITIPLADLLSVHHNFEQGQSFLFLIQESPQEVS